MHGLHKLLWDIRNIPEVRQRFLGDRAGVADEYGIGEPERAALIALDFRTLYERGTNPYLLYFCAIQLQVDRADYYAQLRGKDAPA